MNNYPKPEPRRVAFTEALRFWMKLGWISFGGPAGQIAIMHRELVERRRWLSEERFLHALNYCMIALAETTPGPLIMVLQFVGFMAGWNNPPAGMTSPASAVLGALVTTWVTFLPCFVFIFVGAPYIEVIRGNRNLTGALTGVTAAVVGVILNLALVFGATVIWPAGLSAGPDWFALLLGAAAFLALYRFKLDVLWVVLAGGALGLLRGMLLR